MAGLTNKQRLFVEYYLGEAKWNATKAATLAGYSMQTAGQIGHTLLKKVEIQDEIQRRVADVAMGANEVLLRLAEHARLSMADFITVDEDTGAPQIDLRQAEKDGRLHLIKKVRNSPRDGIEIEVHDPQAALVHLGKHHGLFADQLNGLLKTLDLSQLTEPQLERIAAGEDPIRVLLTPNKQQ